MMKAILSTIGFGISIAVCFPLAVLDLYKKQDGLMKLICVEYPEILLGVIVLISIYIKKNGKKIMITSLLRGVVAGAVIDDCFSYICMLQTIASHTTLYSKLLFCFIAILVGCFIINILDKRGFKKAFYAVTVVLFLLIPGGIIINESFLRSHVRQYEATVSAMRYYKGGMRGGGSFVIYFKEKKEIPITSYECQNVDEYDRFIKGEKVIIETYDGLFGLPAVEVRSR